MPFTRAHKYMLRDRLTMRMYVIIVFVSALNLGTLGCDVSLRATVRENASSSQGINQKEGQPQLYQSVSTVTWEVDEGVKVEARMETLAGLMKDAPIGVPVTRLTIKNLATNRIIFGQDIDGRPLSTYIKVLNDDVGEGLVVTWSAGSADRIEILAVTATQVRKILYESYRVDAALVDLSGIRGIDVLITTADGGAGPFYTTRYVWKGERYEAAGRAPYGRLVNTFKRQFNEPRQSRATRPR